MHPATLLDRPETPRFAERCTSLFPGSSSGFSFGTFLEPPPPTPAEALAAAGRDEMKPSISVIAAARRFFASLGTGTLRGEKRSRISSSPFLSHPLLRPLSSLLLHPVSPPSSLLIARNEGMLTRCSAPTFMEMHPLIYPGPACSRLCLTSVLREVYYPPSPPSPPFPPSPTLRPLFRLRLRLARVYPRPAASWILLCRGITRT